MTILEQLVSKGVLISPEVLEKKYDETLIKEVADFFGSDLDILDEEIINNFLFKQKKIKKSQIQIVKEYTKEPKKRSYQDFVDLFNLRFKNISSLLRSRQELSNILSISRLKSKTQNEKVALIGMILDKTFTKNNNIIITLEDQTGTFTVIVRKDERNTALYDIAKDLQLDEIIGITGTLLNQAVFIDMIIFPDIPISNELKKQAEEEYVVFMGDQHFGSKVFIKDSFQKFLNWLKGEIGTDEQRRIAKKVKYIVMSGDLIEGAGTYPGQQEDLEILDVKEQYDEAAKWLKQVPSHIEMVTTVGNHDVGRLAEPQLKPYFSVASSLYELPNLKIVSNPAVLNIAKTEDFPGFNVLLYHGGSLIYYSQNIPSVRAEGGQKKVDQIMKFLLQRRHLAPTHGSTLIIPDPEEDFLFIDQVPDFFVTGHIHRTSAANYRNITMLNTSCWTETTEDQIKRGLQPQPARIIIGNLKTREIKTMNFLSKEEKQKEQEKLQKVKDD
jgi:DNA polymerase II small subunit